MPLTIQTVINIKPYSGGCLGHAITWVIGLATGCKCSLRKTKESDVVILLLYLCKKVYFVIYKDSYLLHSCQVVELGIIDLLLQHELLEVLRCIWLSLQCLKSLNKYRCIML